MIKNLIFMLVTLAMVQGALAQDKKIKLKGVLTARNGDPLPGCTVVVKGEFEASVTQSCGDFEIAIPNNYEGVLVFSCMAPRVWEIELKKLEDKEDIIINLTDWYAFEDGPCNKNFKKEKRIKIF
jgi:hypothetical protein